MKIGKGICYGTFGELVQGVLDKSPFLITLPIPSLKSEATFFPNFSSTEIIGSPNKAKAIAACEKLLQHFMIDIGGTLIINSNIKVGKGLASSSADIVAAMRAVADSFNLTLSEELISCIAIEVEPTDGVMYPDSVAYDFLNGKLIENLGPIPPYHLIGFDFGGVVDTIAFNKIPKDYSLNDKCMFLKAYELAKKGIKNSDLSLLCVASTISATINQKFLPKPLFAEFEQLAHSYGGGIVCAHSGTVIGILVEPNLNKTKELIKHIELELKKKQGVGIKPILFVNGNSIETLCEEQSMSFF
ncbi:kinase [Bacillus sp. T3]|uniref:GHMP family kinase ATP-binding protein n=1 Tax=Bacillus sp. T3 TaxID=467262 RepID=UPI00298217B3|nr:kinase [Bacillus sp. T3]